MKIEWNMIKWNKETMNDINCWALVFKGTWQPVWDSSWKENLDIVMLKNQVSNNSGSFMLLSHALCGAGFRP